MGEIIGIGLSTSIVDHFHDLVFILVFDVQTVSNVLTDGSREEDWLLLDDRNLAMVPLRIKLSDVSSVEENTTFFWVIESLNQGDD